MTSSTLSMPAMIGAVFGLSNNEFQLACLSRAYLSKHQPWLRAKGKLFSHG